MKVAFVGISFCCLTLLFLGSCVNKMVGVELVHTVQIIYYLHFALPDYSLTLSPLQSLSLVALDNLYWQQDCQSAAMLADFQKVPYSAACSERALLLLAIPVGISAISLLVHFLARKHGS